MTETPLELSLYIIILFYPNLIKNMALDCLRMILQYLDNLTLHSCILVSRRFCIEAIPFLWKEPFRPNLSKDCLKHIIDIYLISSSENNINYPLHKRLQYWHPTVRYPVFLQRVKLSIVTKAIEFWLEENIDTHDHLEEIIGQIIATQSKLRDVSLMVKGQNLGTILFPISMNVNRGYSISNLRKLCLTGNCKKTVIFRYVSTKLQQLDIEHLFDLEECNALTELFTRLKQLRHFKIALVQNTHFVSNILNDLNQLQSLATVKFSYIDFKNIQLPLTDNTCPTLKSLEISYCENVPFLPILAHFPNLKIFDISLCYNLNNASSQYRKPAICQQLHTFKVWESNMNFELEHNIILNASLNLKTFYLYGELYGTSRYVPELLTIMTKHSPNLTSLAIPIGQTHFSIFNKIISKWRFLEHLTIAHSFYDSHSPSDSMKVGANLAAFGAAIPSSLRTLNIRCNWQFTSDDFESFLYRCQANLSVLYLGYCAEVGVDHLVRIIQKKPQPLRDLRKVIIYPTLENCCSESIIFTANYTDGFCGPFPCDVANPDW